MEIVVQMAEELKELWPHIFAAAYVLLMIIASAHIVMYKKDTRAAIGWIGVVVMVPVFGAVLYAVLGINRLHRRAVTLRGFEPRRAAALVRASDDATQMLEVLMPEARHLASLDKLIGRLTKRPLLSGNRVVELVNGQQAYPEMLRAIDEAQHSVTMSSYIFGNDGAGHLFADALARAVQRGVAVRVLIDDIGARYTLPSIVRRLHNGGVPVARFLPTLVPGYFAYSNLRSHRKLLVGRRPPGVYRRHEHSRSA